MHARRCLFQKAHQPIWIRDRAAGDVTWPRTTGYGGFGGHAQGAFTSIDSNADYWQNGTQGPKDTTTGQHSVRNKSPDSWLQVYGLNVRKGLPLGFEIGASIAYVARTSHRRRRRRRPLESLFEGFRRGALGYLPDLAIGGGVRTITGAPAAPAHRRQCRCRAFEARHRLRTARVLTPVRRLPVLRSLRRLELGGSHAEDRRPRLLHTTRGRRFRGFSGDDVDSHQGALRRPHRMRRRKRSQRFARRSQQHAGLSTDAYQPPSAGGRPCLPLRDDRRRGQFITDVVAPDSANQGTEATALAGVPRQSTIAVQVGAAF